jgi:hypothetical protein
MAISEVKHEHDLLYLKQARVCLYLDAATVSS